MLKFIKQEIVLVIAFVLAVISCFLVPPSRAYIDYIDFRTLALLFCLMAVVAGLTESGVVARASDYLMGRCRGMMSVFLVLCLLPFFMAMVVTNDVALITFVPFGIAVMTSLNAADMIIPLVVIQTIAANMGSVLTPIGNPQNLYIQSSYDLSAGQFVTAMLPVWIVSLVIVVVMAVAAVKLKAGTSAVAEKKENVVKINKVGLIRSLLSLAVCLMCVFRVKNVDYRITFIAVFVIMFGKVFLKVDYALLMTFVCFFVFSGNLGSLDAVREFVTGFVEKSTFVSSLGLSQIISNVPSAVFLTPFTEDWKGLLLGVDIGGLGTPVASLASLISMKFYMKTSGARTGRFMVVFLALNIIALVVLCGVRAFMV